MKNALYLMLMVCLAVTVGCGGGEDKKPADGGKGKTETPAKKEGDGGKKAMATDAVVSNVSFTAAKLS